MSDRIYLGLSILLTLLVVWFWPGQNYPITGSEPVVQTLEFEPLVYVSARRTCGD